MCIDNQVIDNQSDVSIHKYTSFTANTLKSLLCMKDIPAPQPDIFQCNLISSPFSKL